MTGVNDRMTCSRDSPASDLGSPTTQSKLMDSPLCNMGEVMTVCVSRDPGGVELGCCAGVSHGLQHGATDPWFILHPAQCSDNSSQGVVALAYFMKALIPTGNVPNGNPGLSRHQLLAARVRHKTLLLPCQSFRFAAIALHVLGITGEECHP